MSQTHLLLLVVAVILVGTAIIIGTTAFVGGFTSSNYDNLLNQATNIATQAQHWKTTPQMLDGSPDNLKGDPANFKGLDFSSMGLKSVDDNPLCYQNSVGQFALEIEPDGLWIIGTNVPHQNRVALHVSGSGSEMITSKGEADGDLLVVRGGYPLFASQDANRVSVSAPLTCLSSLASLSGPRGSTNDGNGPGQSGGRLRSVLRLYLTGPIRVGFWHGGGGG